MGECARGRATTCKCLASHRRGGNFSARPARCCCRLSSGTMAAPSSTTSTRSSTRPGSAASSGPQRSAMSCGSFGRAPGVARRCRLPAGGTRWAASSSATARTLLDMRGLDRVLGFDAERGWSTSRPASSGRSWSSTWLAAPGRRGAPVGHPPEADRRRSPDASAARSRPTSTAAACALRRSSATSSRSTSSTPTGSCRTCSRTENAGAVPPGDRRLRPVRRRSRRDAAARAAAQARAGRRACATVDELIDGVRAAHRATGSSTATSSSPSIPSRRRLPATRRVLLLPAGAGRHADPDRAAASSATDDWTRPAAARARRQERRRSTRYSALLPRDDRPGLLVRHASAQHLPGRLPPGARRAAVRAARGTEMITEIYVPRPRAGGFHRPKCARRSGSNGAELDLRHDAPHRARRGDFLPGRASRGPA